MHLPYLGWGFFVVYLNSHVLRALCKSLMRVRKPAWRADLKNTYNCRQFYFQCCFVFFCFFYLEPWNVCLLNVFDAVLLCLSVLTWTSRNLQKQTEYELSFIVLIQIIEHHLVIH